MGLWTSPIFYFIWSLYGRQAVWALHMLLRLIWPKIVPFSWRYLRGHLKLPSSAHEGIFGGGWGYLHFFCCFHESFSIKYRTFALKCQLLVNTEQVWGDVWQACQRIQVLPLPQMYGKALTFKTGGVDGCDSEDSGSRCTLWTEARRNKSGHNSTDKKKDEDTSNRIQPHRRYSTRERNPM